MLESAISAAADVLERLRFGTAGGRTQLDMLPYANRPATLDDAYAVQRELAGRLAGGPAGKTVGWKIGCTTRVMQDYLGIAHPCAGRLYSNQVRTGYAKLAANAYLQLGLECEIAVWLQADLAAGKVPFEAADVADAVASVCASVEIVEHRFADFAAAGAPSLIADDFFSAGAVVGMAVPPGDLPALGELRGGFSVNGAPPEHTGEGVAILGAPLTALAWLANHARSVGCPLARGELVTLGSVVKTIYPDTGDSIVARFEGLPEVRIDVV